MTERHKIENENIRTEKRRANLSVLAATNRQTNSGLASELRTFNNRVNGDASVLRSRVVAERIATLSYA